MEFQLSCFKSWKMMLWKCRTQYVSKFGKLGSGHRTGKGQFSFQSQRKAMQKKCSSYHTIALISHASKVMLKISKPGFSSMWTMNFQMFRLGLEKAEEPEIKLPISVGSLKKWEHFRKTSTSVLWTMPKPLTVQITINCGKFLKRWEYQTTWPAFWEICMQFRKQQLELDMEQQTGSKSRKEYVKAVYCHPACLTYMQSTSWEMLGWMKCKLESRFPGEISTTSDN